jgi:drug/metabolite transporter (DMT)-like permease
MSTPTIKDYAKLHFIVFIWGFTGVLGKLISLDGVDTAWYRMIFAFLTLMIFAYYKKESLKTSLSSAFNFLIVGVIIAIHWATFFEAIKVSTVSVALVCMASSSLFTSFLEPIFFKRRIIWYETASGLIVIFGLYLIFEFESSYTLGIILALTSAFMAAFFTVINGILIKSHEAIKITTYEMLGGIIGISSYLFLFNDFSINGWSLSTSDLIYLLILAVVCTAYAFVESVEIMKRVSPFTVAISVNMEPIYAIIFALLLFGEEEHMSFGFYIGALVIIGTLIMNAIIRKKTKNNV